LPFACCALVACGGGAGASGGSAGLGASGGAGGTGGAGRTGGVGEGGGSVSAGASGRGGLAGAGGGPSGGGSGGRTGGAGSPGAAGAAGGAAGSNTCTARPGAQLGTLTDPAIASPIAPPNPPGVGLMDSDGKLVNAHGGGIIRVCDTYYLHGEYFLSTTTDNDFNGVAMYSSKNLAAWKNEGIILPQQSAGSLLGPMRKGERPHIIRCPSTGEFVLYLHAADTTYQADKEIVYATSAAVNGQYVFKGVLASTGASSSCTVTTVPPSSCSGSIAAHSDMSALSDGNSAYVVTESGWVYTLATDCHSWTSAKQYAAVNGTTGGIEAPTVFKAGSTYYWLGSDKTGWRANDDFYSTAPAMNGPWTYQGYLAPAGALTWMSQTTWVMPVAGSAETTYVYLGDHWYGTESTAHPGQHNDLATYVVQPLIFTGTKIGLPTYQVSWTLDVGAGTWSPN
jgi:hypothetical protein